MAMKKVEDLKLFFLEIKRLAVVLLEQFDKCLYG